MFIILQPFLVVKEILERAEESISLEEMVAAGRQLENTCNELLNHLSNMCSADGSQGFAIFNIDIIRVSETA